MFCDGKCIKKNWFGKEIARCGLLMKMEQQITPTPGQPSGTPNKWEECAFAASINGQNVLRQALVGVQQAVEHARNQKNVDDGRMLEVVAQGMAGIMLAAVKDPKAASALQRMTTVLDEAKKIQKDGEEGKRLVEGGEKIH